MALIELLVAKCEYVVQCDVNAAFFHKLNAPVAEQNILAATLMVDTVEGRQLPVKLKHQRI